MPHFVFLLRDALICRVDSPAVTIASVSALCPPRFRSAPNSVSVRPSGRFRVGVHFELFSERLGWLWLAHAA
jgi:hypothetical protein